MLDRSANAAQAGAFGARPNACTAPEPDIVDADYIVVDPVTADMGPSVPTMDTTASPAQANAPMPDLNGMDMLRRRVLTAQSSSARAGPTFWAAGIVIAAAGFWIAGGHAVFRQALASPAEAAPQLRIASVISKVDRSGVRPVLQIDGQAVNDSTNRMTMPPLKIQVLSPVGGSMEYKLGTAGSPVEGGGTFAFSSRLDLPKDGVSTVFVTFAR